jgi:hypothetical protein
MRVVFKGYAGKREKVNRGSKKNFFNDAEVAFGAG